MPPLLCIGTYTRRLSVWKHISTNASNPLWSLSAKLVRLSRILRNANVGASLRT